jgi:hypothetical protein
MKSRLSAFTVWSGFGQATGEQAVYTQETKGQAAKKATGNGSAGKQSEMQ